jgi:hypothetical protein
LHVEPSRDAIGGAPLGLALGPDLYGVVRVDLSEWDRRRFSTASAHLPSHTPSPAGKDWSEAAQAGIDLRRWWIEEAFPLDGPFATEERAAIPAWDSGLSREAAELAVGLLA